MRWVYALFMTVLVVGVFSIILAVRAIPGFVGSLRSPASFFGYVEVWALREGLGLNVPYEWADGLGWASVISFILLVMKSRSFRLFVASFLIGIALIGLFMYLTWGSV